MKQIPYIEGAKKATLSFGYVSVDKKATSN